MRVVSGIFKGRKLHTLPGEKTRPTSGKVREAVFSSLQALIPGSVWFDLFAGSGAMGIEALSRGAGFCFFADNNRQACLRIQRNLEDLGIGPSQARLFCLEAWQACALLAKETPGGIHLAYLDPPYGKEELYAKTLDSLEPLLAPEALIVIEHMRGAPPEKTLGELFKSKSYGLAAVSFYRKGSGKQWR